ncbi:MAG: glycosyltransferase family 2 protein [Patescibacteria group bacterium]
MGQKLISAVIIYATDCDKKLFEIAKKSVSWCDELVLVNGIKGSFNDWRNEGLKKAKGDWILYLDSDEEVPENLKIEICKLIGNWKLEIGNYAYAIPRRNFIFNKEFKYSGQYPDYQKRLFKRSALKKWTGIVHEEPMYEGEMGHLKNPMIHHKNMTLSEMVEKTNKWSEIEAKLMFEANHPPMNGFRFFTAGFREFVKRFLKEKAFLDGKEGVIYGIYQIYSKLISYSKLWEMQMKSKI